MLDTDRAAIRDGINTLTREAVLYRSLWQAAWHTATAAQMRVHELERLLTETRAELARYTRERTQ